MHAKMFLKSWFRKSVEFKQNIEILSVDDSYLIYHQSSI